MAGRAKSWNLLEPDLALVERVRQESNLPEPVARALVNRGLEDRDDIQKFLHPKLSDLSPAFSIPGTREAAERIWKAIDDGEKILIFGDYDVDGITSTALVYRVLTAFGGDVCTFIPHRTRDGYGLTVDAFHTCMDNHLPSVVITVDCGTGSADAVAEANVLGVDVIVTDHHEPSGKLAEAFALINPKVGDCPSHLGMLAGVGVAFKLCHAMISVGREQERPAAATFDLRPYTIFAAMGTIADVVPLLGENRALVRTGLHFLNTTTPPGIKALIDVAKISGTVRGHHIGFVLGPRLNAAGRMADAQIALKLLLESKYETAKGYAQELDGANRDRQDVETEIYFAARAQIEETFDPERDYAVVVAGDTWHAGVIGIVASRLVGHFNRPAVVIALDGKGKGKGSCRSIDTFNMVSGLEEVSGMLVKFGGHRMAAGLEIEADLVESFGKALNEVARRELGGHPLRATQRIDGTLDATLITDEFFSLLECMAPFGARNPKPVFMCEGLRIRRGPFIIKERHMKMTLDTGCGEIEAFGFNLGEREIDPSKPINVVFTLNRSSYMGEDNLQLSLIDFEEG